VFSFSNSLIDLKDAYARRDAFKVAVAFRAIDGFYLSASANEQARMDRQLAEVRSQVSEADYKAVAAQQS